VYYRLINRLILMAVALVSIASLSSEAQMRGGFGGGGFRGGGFRSGGFVRSGPAVRVGGGISSFRGSPAIVIGGRFGFGHNPRVGVFFGNRRVFFGNHRVFFKTHFISAFPFGTGFLPSYPFYGYPYYADYSSTVEPAPASYYSAANDNSFEQGRIAQQLQDLRDEVSALREETVAGNRRAPESQPSPEKPKSESLPPTTLVFRDGHREDVQNYAIVGDTLWVLSESRARKRPLADLDVDSTKKANAERGIEFSVPATRR
jgi:hypothetical protein